MRFVWDFWKTPLNTAGKELSGANFKPLTAAQAELFLSPEPFGRSVVGVFPDPTADIDEATRCLALERPTASVFHLMRAMEVGVVALGMPLA